MDKLQLSYNFDDNIKIMDKELFCKDNFDILTKDFLVCGKRARIYVIDGFAKEDTILKIMTSALELKEESMEEIADASSFSKKHIGFVESEISGDFSKIISMILQGPSALFIEGFNEAIIMDTRTYPVRAITEPDSDRALRGSREGLTETLITNIALIRRHIRTPLLAVEHFTVGSVSNTDVVLMYLRGKENENKVERLKFRLKNLKLKSLTMKQESLVEALIHKGWYNPFPKVRYTERPDSAAACIDEGGIVLLVDASPAAMVLPTALIDFFQDTNDYYFPPLVGSYLRLMRFLIYFLTLFFIPTWYLLILNPQYIPPWLSFIKIAEMNDVPVFFQLMLVELVITCLKQASLNTPSSLGSSFSVVGALLLGDFAVKARWFVPEVLLYMAFVAVANFAQPSYELGYAVKLMRMMLIILTGIFNAWGYFAGCAIIIFLIAENPTLTGQSYFYPIFPFDKEKLMRALLRRKMDNENS